MQISNFLLILILLANCNFILKNHIISHLFLPDHNKLQTNFKDIQFYLNSRLLLLFLWLTTSRGREYSYLSLENRIIPLSLKKKNSWSCFSLSKFDYDGITLVRSLSLIKCPKEIYIHQLTNTHFQKISLVAQNKTKSKVKLKTNTYHLADQSTHTFGSEFRTNIYKLR